MSPLRIEILGPQRDTWFKVSEIKPGEQPGSVSQNLPDGGREVYLFAPEPDDSKSVIHKSRAGVDIVSADTRHIITEDLELIASLASGESYTLSLRSDIATARRIIRFTHETEKSSSI